MAAIKPLEYSFYQRLCSPEILLTRANGQQLIMEDPLLGVLYDKSEDREKSLNTHLDWWDCSQIEQQRVIYTISAGEDDHVPVELRSLMESALLAIDLNPVMNSPDLCLIALYAASLQVEAIGSERATHTSQKKCSGSCAVCRSD